MKRIGAIDIFRGMCIFYMTFGHMMEWWLDAENFWGYNLIWNFGAVVGGGGFLMVSGMSAAISYRSRMAKFEQGQGFSRKAIRNEYMIRALEILIISFIWNIGGVLSGLVPIGIKGVWLWFVIQTISISLILAWPLLKVSRSIRVIICFACWIGNEFIFILLLPFQDQANWQGVLFYILYNEPKQNVILGYFPFLLMGTVLGDVIFDILSMEDHNEQLTMLKKKIFLPSMIGGTCLIIFGVIFLFPAFGDKETFSSHMFIFGAELWLFTGLLWFKDVKEYKPKKSYRLFYYYSYYSFTIFLAHNILVFIFPRVFNMITIWFVIVPLMTLWTVLFRYIHNKWGTDASIKVQISRIATGLTKKIEKRRLKDDN